MHDQQMEIQHFNFSNQINIFYCWPERDIYLVQVEMWPFGVAIRR